MSLRKEKVCIPEHQDIIFHLVVLKDKGEGYLVAIDLWTSLEALLVVVGEWYITVVLNYPTLITRHVLATRTT